MADGFRILQSLIKQTSVRHEAIVSNIANVDTPGYSAKDVKFQDILNDATTEMGIKKTNARHMGSGSNGVSAEVPIETSQTWNDKNNVELDIEVAKMTENAMLFQSAVTMLSAKMRMFKNAMRR